MINTLMNEDLLRKAREFFSLKKMDEAENLCLQILERDRTNLHATQILANIQILEGRYQQGADLLKSILMFQDKNPEILNNLGEAYRLMDRVTESITTYKKAIEFNPSYIKAHQNLAMAYLQDKNYEQAHAAVQNVISLSRSANTPFCKHTSVYKLRHDAEQLDYLNKTGKLSKNYLELAKTYRQLASKYEPLVREKIYFELDDEDAAKIGDTYNKFFSSSHSGCALTTAAINPALDVSQIENDYEKHVPGFTIIDSFLTSEALSSLRQYCLESSIWYGFQAGTYLGAYFNDGFSCPLLFQIAEELRSKMPNVIKDAGLRNLWAYKYDASLSGIPLHADEAAVNVNFWLTPDEAVIDKNNGGLVVYLTEAPLDWNFFKMNADQKSIRDFLMENDAKPINVPYRQNRAVIFNSDLFHRTGDIHFKEGFENRRINVTFLYGLRPQASS